jgi:molybdate transport system ATP-binding protein
MSILVNIAEAVPRLAEFRFKNPICWSLNSNEHWAIIGPNGAGKTLFSNIFCGKIPLKEGEITYCPQDNKPLYEQIKCASFQDIYSLADYKNRYYQQRWNVTEAESPVVRDILDKSGDKESIREYVSLFRIADLLDKKLILLSSGELRKFLIVRMLLSKPEILILDNPFIGLDAESRDLLNELLESIVREQSLQIILILSDPNDIPAIVTHVLPIQDKTLLPSCSREAFLKNPKLIESLFPAAKLPVFRFGTNRQTPATYINALEMKNICIKYGERIILKNLNWTVKKGERWALSGPNGSGKSTLLSLVCADNPQGYANTFYLFDKKRGSGESIWDIKKRIGYVSPEVHLYFHSVQTSIQIVGSGFFDSIGLFRKCTPDQLKIALKWMEIFGIAHLKDRSFSQLSFGEQRLVILARAFVKSPELLILDEPLHGLDISNKQKVVAIIEKFCRPDNKTLIYVTHYLNEIPECVKKYFFMHKE